MLTEAEVIVMMLSACDVIDGTTNGFKAANIAKHGGNELSMCRTVMCHQTIIHCWRQIFGLE